MARVNKDMYIERRTTGGYACGRPRKNSNSGFRDWYMVNGSGFINIYTVKFPKELIGRHIKFRVEILPFKKRGTNDRIQGEDNV